MSFCLNPECQNPQNVDDAEHCAHCGATLRLRRRYRAIAPIGHGGFGRTFLAIDEKKKGQPHCVIKQFLPRSQTPQHLKKAKALFKAEATRLKELGHHPQIPTLLAHITQEQQHYLVQEFIAGHNLEQALQAQGAFTEAQVVWVLASLLPVLDFIHTQDVIHRDIKPANILLGGPPSAQQNANAASPAAHSATLDPQPPVIGTDWSELLQALALETAHGFRDLGIAAERRSAWLSQRLASVPRSIGVADYGRCQQFADQFAAYATLSGSQRQYLVADASRTLYELRRRYGRSPKAQSLAPPEPRRAIAPAAATPPLVLVDFGAAKAVQPQGLSQTGTIIGSPEYLAPEQALGKAVYASDLYSLGVTCLHLLTQTSPLDLFDPHDHVWAWRRYLKQPISPQLGQILDKLVSPGLNRRYPSAAAVLQDLKALPGADLSPDFPPTPPAAPPPISAPPPSPWECVHHLSHPGKLLAIALSPTAPILASSSGTAIRLWDLQSGQLMRTLTGHIDIIPTLAISPDGQTLVSGSADKSIRLWDVQTGQRLGSLSLHTHTVLALALSPDGKWLVSSSMSDPIVLWNFATGLEHHHLYGHEARVDALAFSPDSQLLVSGGGDAMLRLWEVATGDALKPLAGHTGAISSLALSSDGKTLASGSQTGEIKLWSLLTRRLKRSLPPSPDRINALTFSPGHKALLTGSHHLQLWNPRNGSRLDVRLDALAGQVPISAIVMSPFSLKADKRQTLVTANLDGSIRVWQGPKL